jgi:hypothetical protein
MLEMGLDYLRRQGIRNKLQHTTWRSVSWFRRRKKRISIFQSQPIIKIIKLKWINFSITSSCCPTIFVQVESDCDRATVPVTYLKSSKIIANHYNNKSDFSTLYIKADAKYSDERSSQNVTASQKKKVNPG